MPLAAGTKLGPYEILASIGKGGMGEVYRAHDARLSRDVAIKVSSEHFTDRFEREARAIAALNHSNICHLYDVGPNYLVMELIEGESPQGPLPLADALKIARQIADALEAAHERNIVHRDLKPGNIKITPSGTVKVLDFGLAKINPSGDREGAAPDDSPTLTMNETKAGVILGTAAYMSPEQARGKKVDKRADIWAFGVVLHELLTGRRLFAGEDVTDTLAAVLRAEPEWDGVPPSVLPLLKKCLEKDPKDRLRDIGDAWALLQDDAPANPATPPAGRRWLWPGIAAVLTLVAAATAFLWIRATSQPPPPLTRFEVALPRDSVLVSVPQISPDGQTLAFVAAAARKPAMIYLRPLSETASRVLPGTEGASYCFWSADGRSLGFSVGTREIDRIELAGGGPRMLVPGPLRVNNGTWGQQGDILTNVGGDSPVARLAASGGPLTTATRLDEKADEESHRFPQFLPDGKHFLFYVYRSDERHNSVEFSTLGSFDRKKVLEGTSAPRYARDSAGHAYLLYKRGETLMAQKFNESAGAVEGEAVAVADNVGGVSSSQQQQQPQASASLTGTLVYAVGGAQNSLQLTWFDREGKVRGTVGDTASYRDVAMSPDGARAAVGIDNFRGRDIWVLDLDRGISARLTSNGSRNRYPVWSPDGKQIVFSSQRNGHDDLLVRAADGTGGEELLFHSDQSKYAFNRSWSRDGRYLIYTSLDLQTKYDLWILPMEGDRKPLVFLRTPFNEGSASFSPDGRWISYFSDESGRYELYVRPFTPPGSTSSSAEKASEGKWRISKDGATEGWWREDGKELIFASGRSVMSVDVSTSPSFHTGVPRELFQLPPNAFLAAGTQDLKKLLVEVTQAPPPPPITVVLNWPSAFK
jgi:serine/threonine protein kinase/WD40 repeat protein